MKKTNKHCKTSFLSLTQQKCHKTIINGESTEKINNKTIQNEFWSVHHFPSPQPLISVGIGLLLCAWFQRHKIPSAPSLIISSALQGWGINYGGLHILSVALHPIRSNSRSCSPVNWEAIDFCESPSKCLPKIWNDFCSMTRSSVLHKMVFLSILELFTFQ